jgi:hypothetical protein
MTISILPTTARPYSNVYTVDVTPELAKLWLAVGRFNRRVNYSAVAKYVRQINAGLWRCTHQGVAFTREGVLIDGQHRLLAVVKTGKTVRMIVFTDEPIENFAFIDCGRNRSNLDTMRLGQADGTLSSLHTQTVRSFLAGRFCQTANRWSNAEVNEEYEKHHEAINHVVELFAPCKDKRLNDPTVRGLLARAYYHVAPERITEFATKLIYCNGKGGDPISVLWQCLHVWNNRQIGTKCEIYRRTMQTFLGFLHNRTDVGKIDVSTDIFPIPKQSDTNVDEV